MIVEIVIVTACAISIPIIVWLKPKCVVRYKDKKGKQLDVELNKSCSKVPV